MSKNKKIYDGYNLGGVIPSTSSLISDFFDKKDYLYSDSIYTESPLEESQRKLKERLRKGTNDIGAISWYGENPLIIPEINNSLIEKIIGNIQIGTIRDSNIGYIGSGVKIKEITGKCNIRNINGVKIEAIISTQEIRIFILSKSFVDQIITNKCLIANITDSTICFISFGCEINYLQGDSNILNIETISTVKNISPNSVIVRENGALLQQINKRPEQETKENTKRKINYKFAQE